MKKIIALSATLISLSVLMIASVLFGVYINDTIGGISLILIFIGIVIVLIFLIEEATPIKKELQDQDKE